MEQMACLSTFIMQGGCEENLPIYEYWCGKHHERGKNEERNRRCFGFWRTV